VHGCTQREKGGEEDRERQGERGEREIYGDTDVEETPQSPEVGTRDVWCRRQQREGRQTQRRRGVSCPS
jgi:hypothetical protein